MGSFWASQGMIIVIRRYNTRFLAYNRCSVRGSCCCLVTQFLSCSFATQWTVAHQASLSMGFPRQEHWSGLPFPSPGDLPDPGIEPASPALTHGFFTTEPPGTHVIIGSWAGRDSRRNVVQWMGRSKLRGAEPCPVPQSSQGRLSMAKISPALLPSLFFLFVGPLCVCGHTHVQIRGVCCSSGKSGSLSPQLPRGLGLLLPSPLWAQVSWEWACSRESSLQQAPWVGSYQFWHLGKLLYLVGPHFPHCEADRTLEAHRVIEGFMKKVSVKSSGQHISSEP